MAEELTEAEQEELNAYLKAYGAPVPEEKHNVHTFLNNVAKSDDTTKTGFLKDEEIGTPLYPTRSYKHLANFADKVMNQPELATFLKGESEILTSTSLSRDGFLVNRAVLQVKHIADVTKSKKENKGWFKKKDENKQGEDNI